MSTLLTALQKLTESKLSQEVIKPLLSTIYNAPVEYVHGPSEQGRDLVCMTTDELSEDAVICVQVKAHPLSPGPSKGSRSIHAVAQQAFAAKIQGVTLENGAQFPVSKVLIITPFPFTDSQRRNVSDLLKQLHLANCTLIAGERLAYLLSKNCPDVATQIAQYANPKIAALLTQMSSHVEARAFGLPHDRSVSDFLIPLRIWPSFKSALSLILGTQKIDLGSYFPNIPLPIEIASRIRSLPSEQRKVEQPWLNTALKKHLQAHDPLISKWTIPIDKIILKTDTLKSKAEDSGPIIANPGIILKLGRVVARLVRAARDAWKTCPSAIDEDPTYIVRAYKELQRLEDFLEDISAHISLSLVNLSDFDLEAALARSNSAFTLRLPQRLNLLRLGSPLMIDGPPGCGKTTLLRSLSIELIEQGDTVVFVPCARIKRPHKIMPLIELARKLSLNPEVLLTSTKDVILLLDGLDEAQIDIGMRIAKEYNQFKAIIATCRSAFPTQLRPRASMVLGLAPYSYEERNEFLRRWFADSPRLAKLAQEFVQRYEDLDRHTRVPMLATLLAALVEAGREPRSRCEMYDGRLDLLLQKWDAVRGVERRRVLDTELKRRFLMHLAYNIHKHQRGRFFGRNEMKRVFDLTVGTADVPPSFDDLVRDLVLAHGILLEVEPDIFSFGHLTFQEHLAGLYLAAFLSPREILPLCTNFRWLEPLKFYAGSKGEITQLIYEAVTAEKLDQYCQFLEQMLPEARYTSMRARDILGLTIRVGPDFPRLP